MGKYQKWLQANKPMFAAQTFLIIFCFPKMCTCVCQDRAEYIQDKNHSSELNFVFVWAISEPFCIRQLYLTRLDWKLFSKSDVESGPCWFYKWRWGEFSCHVRTTYNWRQNPTGWIFWIHLKWLIRSQVFPWVLCCLEIVCRRDVESIIYLENTDMGSLSNKLGPVF